MGLSPLGKKTKLNWSWIPPLCPNCLSFSFWVAHADHGRYITMKKKNEKKMNILSKTYMSWSGLAEPLVDPTK